MQEMMRFSNSRTSPIAVAASSAAYGSVVASALK
jgi:hypothetical protein